MQNIGAKIELELTIRRNGREMLRSVSIDDLSYSMVESLAEQPKSRAAGVIFRQGIRNRAKVRPYRLFLTLIRPLQEVDSHSLPGGMRYPPILPELLSGAFWKPNVKKQDKDLFRGKLGLRASNTEIREPS